MKTKADLARELIRKHPKAPSKTLARRLYTENKLHFPNLESARSAIRRARGNNGSASRKETADKSGYRKNGKAGWAPKLPPSQAEPWKPYKLPHPSTALVVSDAHIPYHDDVALDLAIVFAKREHNPDVVLLNGDWCDFYSVSRWDRDPKKRNFVAEIEAIRESLSYLRGHFPKAKIVFKVGNHEERWHKFIWNKAPELWGLSEVGIDHLLELEKLGIDFVCDERPVFAGKLPIFHGHELPRGLTNPVNMARGAFLRMIDSVLVGHGHRTSSHAEYTWDKRPIACWSTGCLCDITPRYARINKWNHGFAVVEIAKNRDFNVHNYSISDNGDVWST